MTEIRLFIIEKIVSESLSLVTTSILGQPPR